MKAFMSDPRAYVQSWKMCASAKPELRDEAIREAERIQDYAEPYVWSNGMRQDEHVSIARMNTWLKIDPETPEAAALRETLAAFVEE